MSICRIYNGVQRIRPVVANRKIIRARRKVGNKCRLYKHFVVAAKTEKNREMAIFKEKSERT